jgi:hypothetical protein
MREPVGSPAFHQRYSELMVAEPLSASIIDRAPKSNTFRWLCIQSFGSPDFKRLGQRTQYVSRRIVESMFEDQYIRVPKRSSRIFP